MFAIPFFAFMNSDKQNINVLTNINQSTELTWEAFTVPSHLQMWAKSADDWEVSVAENDVKIGGRLKVVLTTNENSIFLQYSGVYQKIELNQHMLLTLEDGRSLEITFSSLHDVTQVQLNIDAVSEQPLEVQLFGWQSLLDHLKVYAESISDENHIQDNFLDK